MSHDPPLVAVHAAYSRQQSIIVDYSVGGREIVDDKQEVRSHRYWAEFLFPAQPPESEEELSTHPSERKPRIVVHRDQLDPASLVGWSVVRVYDASSTIVGVEYGSPRRNAFMNEALAIPPAILPAVIFAVWSETHFPLPYVHDGFFAIVYIDPEKKDKAILSDQPREDYEGTGYAAGLRKNLLYLPITELLMIGGAGLP